MDSSAGRRTGGSARLPRALLFWVVLAWALIAFAAFLLPHGPALLRRAPWEVWPLDPAVGVPLVLAVVLYLRGVRRAAAVPAAAPSIGRQAAFLGGIAALALALQSPILAMAPRSFALDVVVQMLLRTVAPALLVMAQPMSILALGLSRWRRAGAPPSVAFRILRAVTGGLSHPLPATALYVGAAYFWAWPPARDAALLDPLVRAAMDATLVLSGLAFFRGLFDLRPEPMGPTIGTRLLMIWGAELANILLGYYLTYTSLPLYPAYAVHGLLWGLTPIANEIYGGQTLWLCDTAMIGAAAMVVIFRWARDEDRLRARPGPGTDRAAYLARQRASNRRVVLGLLGFVGMIAGVMGASVALYEVSYHHGATHPSSVSVNQLP